MGENIDTMTREQALDSLREVAGWFREVIGDDVVPCFDFGHIPKEDVQRFLDAVDMIAGPGAPWSPVGVKS